MANKDEKQTTSVPAEDPKDALIKQLEKQLAAANAEKAAAEKKLDDLKSAQEKNSEADVQDTGKVTIKLYKDQNIKDDVQAFVNGRQYIIQRGVEVAVPRAVFEVLQNQEKMRNHIAAYNEKHAAK